MVLEQFGEDFMRKVEVLAGGNNFTTLFRNVAALPDPSAASGDEGDEGADFLDALAQASEGLTLSEPLETGTVQTITAPEIVSGPSPRANASAEDRAIVERVYVNNGNWEISVARGDSLATIAAAIYGDAQSYTLIFDANRDVLSNPSNLDIGIRLRLPKP